MKNIFKLLPLLFLILACQNKDLVLQKSKKNCSCIQQLNMNLNPDCNYLFTDCHRAPFALYSEDSTNIYFSKRGNDNFKLFSKTNSIELVNKSKTKVYEVLIQKNDNDIVSYTTHTISPTETIALGCDSKFTVYDGGNADEWGDDCGEEKIVLSNLSKIKIEYKIHKIKLVSEF